GIAFAVAVGRVFTLPPQLVSVARFVLVLGGITIATTLVSGVFGGIITARQRFDTSSSIEMAVALVRAVGVVLVLRGGLGLVALAVVQLAASVIRGLADFVYSRRLYPEIRIRLGDWSRDHARQLLTFSWYATLLHVSGMVILQMDSIVIGAF